MKQILPALVVDDDAQVRTFVAQILKDCGWDVSEAESAEQAFELSQQSNWAAVFCDVNLGGADGFSVLRRLKEEQPDAKVVLITGEGSAAGALDATAFGAYDYLLKPIGFEELESISFALREQLESKSRRISQRTVTPSPAHLELIGRSQAFISVMKQVGRIAPTNLTVLLTGESGTGKGVVASALHRHSGRAEQPFVAVNCGAIPSELIESELFGHVKGSFTGADRDRRGLWEEATGGTMFLDEITETSLTFQVKLLHVLQENEIRRVGSNQTQKVDVRVIAASNRDVEAEVAAGRFREDLFYRLNAVSIQLPPLRERREDIPPLAHGFIERMYSLNPIVKFSAETSEVLEKYPWPGNIRELENAVVRAAAMCDGIIRVQDLPDRIRKFQDTGANDIQPTDSNDSSTATPQEWPLLSVTVSRYLAQVLEHTRWNKQAASRLLGVDRKTLGRMILRHHLAPPKNVADNDSKSPT